MEEEQRERREEEREKTNVKEKKRERESDAGASQNITRMEIIHGICAKTISGSAMKTSDWRWEISRLISYEERRSYTRPCMGNTYAWARRRRHRELLGTKRSLTRKLRSSRACMITYAWARRRIRCRDVKSSRDPGRDVKSSRDSGRDMERGNRDVGEGMGHDPLDPYEEEMCRAAFEGRRFRANLSG